jgi:hypothetical protein
MLAAPDQKHPGIADRDGHQQPERQLERASQGEGRDGRSGNCEQRKVGDGKTSEAGPAEHRTKVSDICLNLVMAAAASRVS